jgi:DNA-binding NarL/FixJ family response regulator
MPSTGQPWRTPPRNSARGGNLRPTRSPGGPPTAARIRLVLADEHPIVLDGLERVLSAQRDCRPLARCLHVDQTLAAVREHRPHVLILDPHLPGANHLSILHDLRRDHPDTRVVLFAASLSDEEAIEALRLGVRGMVLKQQASEQLIRCVRKVHGGGEWIEKNAIGSALRTLLRREAGMREAAAVLTPRELETVRMVARGLGNRLIADRLSISRGTVRVHLHNVYRKLKVAGRLALILYAREKQLV